MSDMEKIVFDCMGELSDSRFKMEKAEVLNRYIARRINKFSDNAAEEIDYNLKIVKRRINNSDISLIKRIRELDNFSKASIGISVTCLGFLSSLILANFKVEGEETI